MNTSQFQTQSLSIPEFVDVLNSCGPDDVKYPLNVIDIRMKPKVSWENLMKE